MTTQEHKGRLFFSRLKSIIRNPALSVEARFLWVLLDSYEDRKKGSIYPAISTLAKDSGHPPLWVKRRLKELKDKGFIKIGKKQSVNGWVNFYELNVKGNWTGEGSIGSDTA